MIRWMSWQATGAVISRALWTPCACSRLSGAISSAAAPHRITSCRSRLPWVTSDVLRLMRRRNEAFHRARKKDTPDMWCLSRAAKNKAVAALRSAKRHFLGQLSNDSQQFWSTFRSATQD